MQCDRQTLARRPSTPVVSSLDAASWDGAAARTPNQTPKRAKSRQNAPNPAIFSVPRSSRGDEAQILVKPVFSSHYEALAAGPWQKFQKTGPVWSGLVRFGPVTPRRRRCEASQTQQQPQRVSVVVPYNFTRSANGIGMNGEML